MTNETMRTIMNLMDKARDDGWTFSSLYGTSERMTGCILSGLAHAINLGRKAEMARLRENAENLIRARAEELGVEITGMTFNLWSEVDLIPPLNPHEGVGTALGMAYNDLRGMEAGFCNWGYAKSGAAAPLAYAMGRFLREKYHPDAR